MTAPEGMTDSDLIGWAEQVKVEVQDRQREVAERLRDLAACAEYDARSVVLSTPSGWAPTYPEQVEAVRRARQHLDEADADLKSVSAALDRRYSIRDTAGSASRQHYIDTGNYLPADAEVTT